MLHTLRHYSDIMLNFLFNFTLSLSYFNSERFTSLAWVLRFRVPGQRHPLHFTTFVFIWRHEFKMLLIYVYRWVTHTHTHTNTQQVATAAAPHK